MCTTRDASKSSGRVPNHLNATGSSSFCHRNSVWRETPDRKSSKGPMAGNCPHGLASMSIHAASNAPQTQTDLLDGTVFREPNRDLFSIQGREIKIVENNGVGFD